MLDETVINEATLASRPVTRRSQGLPGVLRGEILLTLNTVQACMIFNGRQRTETKPSIPGIFTFANRLKALAFGVAAEDPYADWYLVQIERALDEAGQTIRHEQQISEQHLATLDGLTVAVAQSIRPQRLTLRLRAPHALRAARLVGRFDRAVASLLTLVHVGALGRRESQRRIGIMSRSLRRAVNLACTYRFIGVTRDDVREQTPRAIEAARVMQTLPLEILDRSLTPRFRVAPRRSNPLRSRRSLDHLLT